MPTRPANSPFKKFLPVNKGMATRPNMIIAKYSGGPKLMMMVRKTGINKIKTRTPKIPPRADAAADVPTASPALPCCAIG